MRGRRFLAAEEVVDMLENNIFCVSSRLEKFSNGWFKRMEKCIVHKDRYFVKQKCDFHKIINAF